MQRFVYPGESGLAVQPIHDTGGELYPQGSSTGNLPTSLLSGGRIFTLPVHGGALDKYQPDFVPVREHNRSARWLNIAETPEACELR